MKRNWLFVVVCALLLGVGQAQDVREVTFWTGHGEPDLSALQQIVDDFNAENPDINVTLVQIPPGDVTDVTRLMTAVRGGTGPDVYMLDRFIVAQRAADGLLQDLTPYMGGEDVLAEYTSLPATRRCSAVCPTRCPSTPTPGRSFTTST